MAHWLPTYKMKGALPLRSTDGSTMETETAPTATIDHRPVAVVIVDDHVSYRGVAAAVVEATPDFELVGTASSAESALELLLSIDPPPDLVLMDVNLGERSGIDVTREVCAARPGLKVVLVSALAIEDLPADSRTSGAAGYLPKLLLSPASLERMAQGSYDWRP